jgi:hypothetical protein
MVTLVIVRQGITAGTELFMSGSRFSGERGAAWQAGIDTQEFSKSFYGQIQGSGSRHE